MWALVALPNLASWSPLGPTLPPQAAAPLERVGLVTMGARAAGLTDEQQLIRAYQDYYGAYDPREIIQSLEKVLTGELRNVIGEMTPEQLRHEKEEFNNRVTEGASKRMKALGFELVNLNLSDVTDKNGYFDNTATAELEDKRQTAANIKAESDRNIRVVKANADQMAKDAEIAAQLITDERELDASIKRAEYKTQRDTAEADAEVAGELQRTKRAQEVAVNEGAVAVVKAQQDQLAADAERAAIMTRAETARKREVVEAEAEKDKAKIKAAADADRGVPEVRQDRGRHDGRFPSPWRCRDL